MKMVLIKLIKGLLFMDKSDFERRSFLFSNEYLREHDEILRFDEILSKIMEVI